MDSIWEFNDRYYVVCALYWILKSFRTIHQTLSELHSSVQIHNWSRNLAPIQPVIELCDFVFVSCVWHFTSATISHLNLPSFSFLKYFYNTTESNGIPRTNNFHQWSNECYDSEREKRSQWNVRKSWKYVNYWLVIKETTLEEAASFYWKRKSIFLAFTMVR